VRLLPGAGAPCRRRRMPGRGIEAGEKSSAKHVAVELDCSVQVSTRCATCTSSISAFRLMGFAGAHTNTMQEEAESTQIGAHT
jgi:hypothetical protein